MIVNCIWYKMIYVKGSKLLNFILLQVLHSQCLWEKPLRSWVVAERDGAVVCSHCDCQAGLGEVCTHVSALLFSIESIARIWNERTVTQKPAYWKLPPEMKKLEYSQLFEMDLTSAKSLKKKLDAKIVQNSVPDIPKPKQKEIAKPTDIEMKNFYEELFQTNTKPVDNPSIFCCLCSTYYFRGAS